MSGRLAYSYGDEFHWCPSLTGSYREIQHKKKLSVETSEVSTFGSVPLPETGASPPAR